MIPEHLIKHFKEFNNIEFREIPIEPNKTLTRNVIFLNQLKDRPILSNELENALNKSPELIVENVKIADNYFLYVGSKIKFQKSIDTYVGYYK